MPTRLTLHRFESDPGLEQRDGVNLAHTEICRLLASPDDPGLEVQFHDFDRLLRDPGYALETLAGVDCVLSNVGPHAHYYHYLRERLGLDFRIVRDIKTALWSSYLLQESLCEAFLRPRDALLATSHYSRVLVQRLFPHLEAGSIHIFEPVLAEAVDAAAPPRAHPGPGETVTLGYVGRLSEDKNFPQVVELLIALNQGEPGRYRLVACGAIHSASCDPAQAADRIQAETGLQGLFTYLPPVPHDRILPLLRTFDYFLFFSTSNLEVLGRVVIEAAAAGVPVLATDHAAAAELLAPTSLLPVDYALHTPFQAHFDAPLGRVDIAQAGALIRQGAVPDPPPATLVNRLESFLDVLMDRPSPEAPETSERLPGAQQSFVGQLRWDGMTRFPERSEARKAIEELLDWFCALNGKAAGDISARLEELERRSRFKERTRRYIETLARTRGDFTNLGGIDIELCNIARYHPRFWLDDPPLAE